MGYPELHRIRYPDGGDPPRYGAVSDAAEALALRASSSVTSSGRLQLAQLDRAREPPMPDNVPYDNADAC